MVIWLADFLFLCGRWIYLPEWVGVSPAFFRSTGSFWLGNRCKIDHLLLNWREKPHVHVGHISLKVVMGAPLEYLKDQIKVRSIVEKIYLVTRNRKWLDGTLSMWCTWWQRSQAKKMGKASNYAPIQRQINSVTAQGWEK